MPEKMYFAADEELLNRYFPYKVWRPGQLKLAKRVYKAIKNYEILLVGYPIGFGKTSATLTAALSTDVEKIIYVVRTKSQFQAPLREIRRLRKKGLSINTAVIRSKQDYCPLRFSKNVGYKEFLVLCSRLRGEGGCPYRTAEPHVSSDKDASPIYQGVMGVRAAWKLGKEAGKCPYDVMLGFIEKARVLVTSYPYLFSPDLRKLILEKGGFSLENSVVIIDEAHNIVDTISGMTSTAIGLAQIKELRKEVKLLPPSLAEHIGRRLSLLQGMIRKSATEKTYVEIDPGSIISILPSKDMLLKAAWIIEKDTTMYVSRLRRLIEIINFIEKYSGGLVVYASSDRGEPRLHIELYDPSKVVEEVFAQVRAAILLSATMPPRDYLVEMMGIKHRRVEEIVYPYVWGENAEVFLVKGVTSRYSERGEKMYKRYGALINLLTSENGVTLVMFPSYSFMHSTYKYVRVSPLVIEKRSTSLEDIESKIRESLEQEGRAVVLATAWGKLVEGIEFTRGGRSLIERIVVAGLPVAEPTIRNKKMLAKLQVSLGSSRKAWEIVFIYPGVFKVVQAIGRGLRSREDRVSVYILDERGEKYLAGYLEKYGFRAAVVGLKELLGELGYMEP